MTNITPEQQKESKKIQTPIKDEPSLKGAFVSVMLLGGFLVLSWVAVFYLFISRN
ncbi:cytochrome c oxidase subunit 2A [Caldalkalibacillus mannanilyticus]|uniref:cytochrome c oxidase subunit 2A n=1 Tax=Caldalkalibacillus mannanilyticus TaxID=1418 RepID=UPI000AC67C62|nr:cytochrome c oxidase subunit 2A [Caldalkalibacillus mannanilyticus]